MGVFKCMSLLESFLEDSVKRGCTSGGGGELHEPLEDVSRREGCAAGEIQKAVFSCNRENRKLHMQVKLCVTDPESSLIREEKPGDKPGIYYSGGTLHRGGADQPVEVGRLFPVCFQNWIQRPLFNFR